MVEKQCINLSCYVIKLGLLKLSACLLNKQPTARPYSKAHHHSMDTIDYLTSCSSLVTDLKFDLLCSKSYILESRWWVTWWVGQEALKTQGVEFKSPMFLPSALAFSLFLMCSPCRTSYGFQQSSATVRDSLRK